MHRNTGLFYVTQKRNYNRRVPVRKAIYSQQGDHLVLAGDGTLRLWGRSYASSRKPDLTILAHSSSWARIDTGRRGDGGGGDEGSGGAGDAAALGEGGVEEDRDDDGRGMDVAVAQEIHMVVTRGGPGDDTVKVWDLRKPGLPLSVLRGLLAHGQGSSCVFSPDYKYLAVSCAITVNAFNLPPSAATAAPGESAADEARTARTVFHTEKAFDSTIRSIHLSARDGGEEDDDEAEEELLNEEGDVVEGEERVRILQEKRARRKPKLEGEVQILDSFLLCATIHCYPPRRSSELTRLDTKLN
jgi:hypothetical protein